MIRKEKHHAYTDGGALAILRDPRAMEPLALLLVPTCMKNSLFLAATVLVAACSGNAPDGYANQSASDPNADTANALIADAAGGNMIAENVFAPTQPASAEPDDAAEAKVPDAPLIGERTAVREWRKADNYETCAPLALMSDAGGRGDIRSATFSGGWAVAFDRPNLRSAYGFAGSGLIPQDGETHRSRVARIAAQWPHDRRYGQGENLPAGSFAGYGLEGAEDYKADNPTGRGENSLAYLYIPGQACMYNVWSRLGRDHLNALLGNLQVIPQRRR